MSRSRSIKTVIPNVGYAYPQGWEPGHLGAREKKKLNTGGKMPLLDYLFTVTTYKFEITAAVLITNILRIWRVQFMEIGCHGVREWKKVGKHCIKRKAQLRVAESANSERKIWKWFIHVHSYLIEAPIRKCTQFSVFSFDHFNITTTSDKVHSHGTKYVDMRTQGFQPAAQFCLNGTVSVDACSVFVM